MIGGQEIDLEGEDRPKNYEKLLRMHRKKTGALIVCAAMLGVLAAGKYDDKKIKDAVFCYADGVGLTFQIVDDILDYTASYLETGKTTSDVRNNKTTFLSFMTAEEAFDKAVGLTNEATRAVDFFDKDHQLSDLARYLLFRRK